jgi:hypothetical protein
MYPFASPSFVNSLLEERPRYFTQTEERPPFRCDQLTEVAPPFALRHSVALFLKNVEMMIYF